jgi:hypothetical protein
VYVVVDPPDGMLSLISVVYEAKDSDERSVQILPGVEFQMRTIDRIPA